MYYEKVRTRCSLEISVYVDMAQCYHEIGNIPESKRILFLASKLDSSHKEVMSLLKEYEYECSICANKHPNSSRHFVPPEILRYQVHFESEFSMHYLVIGPYYFIWIHTLYLF